MHLITMAHMGEAQGVIENFGLKNISSDLFGNEELLLLLTGEGPLEAATKTAHVLGRYKVDQVLNLGIAGTLDAQYAPGEIHQVRTIYLVNDMRPQFRTFKSSEKGLDCITSFERILDPEKARTLKGMGTLVDREAWGVAMAAKTAGVPFTSFKLISDVAGTLEACELVRDSAEVFSKSLAQFLANRLNKEIKDSYQLPGFHFTFSMEHKFSQLIKKISIKEEQSEEMILSSLPVEEMRERKLSPKEKARLLLESLEERIDPTKAMINHKLKLWEKPLKDSGVKIFTDPSLEKESVTFTLEASSDEELNEKARLLQKFSLKSFKEVMNGDFDVE